MKKVLLSLLCALSAVVAIQAQAVSEFTVDGITYLPLTENTLLIKEADANLTEVVIPATISHNGVTYTVVQIGSGELYVSFSNCSQLVSVTLPPTLTTICRGAFYSCGNLESINLENVTSIADHAFMECTKLKEVTLSSGLKELQNHTFIDCSSLSKVTIPTNGALQSIGTFAFYRCSSLTEIEFPRELQTIGSWAFARNAALKSVTFHANCSIDNEAFQDCYGLEAVYVEDMSGTRDPLGMWLYYRFAGQNSNPLKFARHLYINGIECTKIDDSAIGYTIPNYAFINCESITEIELNKINGIYEIGEYAFSGCTSLESVTLSQSIGKIGPYAFSGCKAMTSLQLSENLATVPMMAFNGCTSLERLDIPASVKQLEMLAFGNCTAVNTIEVYAPTPPECTATGMASPFAGIDATLHVLKGTEDVYRQAPVWSDFTNIVADLIPKTEEVTAGPLTYHVDNQTGTATVYYSDTDVVSVEVPATITYNDREYPVTTIGYGAFTNCPDLVSVKLPEGLTTVEYSAFFACRNVTEINLPSTLTTLDEYAFAFMSSLKSLTVPGSIKTIPFLCFESLNSLTELTIEPGVIEIGDIAFRNADNLTTLTLPESVETIGMQAFAYMDNLKTLSLPSTLTNIGFNAFSGCTALTEVYCAAVEPPVCDTTGWKEFMFTNTGATLHVPIGTKEAYASAPVWQDFENIVDDVAGADSIIADSNDIDTVNVYNLQGMRLPVDCIEQLKTLPRGLYIVNGKKMLLNNR